MRCQDEEDDDDEEDEDDEVNDSLSPIPLSITKHDLVQQDHELVQQVEYLYHIGMMTLCLHNQDEDDEEEEEEEGSEEEEEEEEEGGTTDEVASVDKGATPATTGARYGWFKWVSHENDAEIPKLCTKLCTRV